MSDLLDIEYIWSIEESNGCNVNIFDIYKYEPEEKVVMHCSSLKQAKIFLEYLDNYGYNWCSGESYLNSNEWERFKENTCYCFLEGTYDYLEYFIDEDYEILEFSDFNWEGYDE